MADQLVDTNVLIVGSAAVEPGYGDVSVSADDIDTVFCWLAAFRDDAARKLVLDDAWKIYDEYHHKLNGQHFGLQVVHHKLQECLRTMQVAYDADGHGVVPAALAAIDNSDKKFVAAALNDPTNIHIVNAADSDWRQQAQALLAHGIVVVELLP
jgi:hypothetical protein